MGVFLLDDKNEQIYSQYTLQIDNVYKSKGIVYLETKDGLYMIKSYNYTDKKIKSENKVKEILNEKGYVATDICIKNKGDDYISYNKYMNKYIVKKWFYGEECDISNKEHVCRISENLGTIHSLMSNIEIDEDDCSKIGNRNLIKEYHNQI